MGPRSPSRCNTDRAHPPHTCINHEGRWPAPTGLRHLGHAVPGQGRQQDHSSSHPRVKTGRAAGQARAEGQRLRLRRGERPRRHGRQGQEAGASRASTSPPPAGAPTRAPWMASQVGPWGSTARACRAWITRTTSVLRGYDGKRREAGPRWASGIRRPGRGGTRPGRRAEAHHRRGEGEQGRGRAGRRGAGTFTPKRASAIVMDPDTGEILAMANWPRVGNNRQAVGAPDSMRCRTWPPAGATSRARRSRRSPWPRGRRTARSRPTRPSICHQAIQVARPLDLDARSRAAGRR